MSQPFPPRPKPATDQVLGVWNLGAELESDVSPDDSLFAPAPPRPTPTGESKRPAAGPAGPSDMRNDPAAGSAAEPHFSLPPIEFRQPNPDPAERRFGHFVIDPGAEAELNGSLFLDSLLAQRNGETPPRTEGRPGTSNRGRPASPPGEKIPKISATIDPDSKKSHAAPFPKPGEAIGGFRILTELGRGAFARVYLAEQIELGNRLVALKVSKPEGEEPQLLARLQHTHIVPIHSVFDDPVSGLRLLCMPYLGGANLAQTLEAAGGRPASGSGECSFVQALDEVSHRLHSCPQSAIRSARSAPAGEPALGAALPEKHVGGSFQASAFRAGPAERPLSLGRDSLSRIHSLWNRIPWRKSRRVDRREIPSLTDRDFDQPARQFLRKATSIQAAAWVIARLAEGLEHAHSRGLLHRDIKPSNVLVTGDGTPMLLDFNLSAPKRLSSAEDGDKAMLGGTLPYMSPEHLDAFNPNGSTHPEAVDERSDIYSLGLILFEMIAREHPFKEPPPLTPLLEVIRHLSDQRKRIPSLRAADPGVPWGLESILRKCLDPSPENRYSRARELAEDLNRFLDDRPLKFAPELSVRERFAKWTRRNPRLCGTTSIAFFAMLLMFSLGGLIQLLHHNSVLMASRLNLQIFHNDLNECRFMLNTSGGPIEHVNRGIEVADRTLRGLGISTEGDWRSESFVRRLTRNERVLVGHEAVELILLDAAAHVYVANRQGSEADRSRALNWAVSWLDRAEKLDAAPPPSLYADRSRYHEALGRKDMAATDRRRAETTPPTSARDYSLLGTSLIARGDIARAEAAFLRAVDLEPQRFWGWFGLGHCHFEQGRYLDAAGDFGSCLVLESNFAWPYLNRGLCLARVGRLHEARDSYRQALKRNERFAEAWLNLALVDLELDDVSDAERCLGQAMALGRKETNVLVVWAEIKARKGHRGEAEATFAQLLKARRDDPMLLTARGIFRIENDREGSLQDLRKAIEIDPSNPRAHFGLALALRRDDPKRALIEADAAYRADPRMMDALQLRALLRARAGNLAALDDAERLCQVQTPHRLYNAACTLALLAENAGEKRLTPRAIEFLHRALELGFPLTHAENDPDLASLRSSSAYQELLARHRPSSSK